MDRETLLRVENLKTWFFTDEGIAKAVDGVSFSISKGKTLALVGESGCGKSVTALSILKLIPDPPGKIVEGEIIYSGQNLMTCGEREMLKVRGNKIAMIFQEPMTALNPVFTIGNQIVETIRLHQNISRRESRELAVELLRSVGISEPAYRLKNYPHHLSGGMRQRAMIAMALACRPGLLIADEPTTALDVTIQAQILELLNALQAKLSTSILLITHDLGVVAQTAHDVAVMYAGKIVEYAEVKELFAHPLHPYTQGLFSAIPRLGAGKRNARLKTIPGQVPNPSSYPSGCRFHPRCPICDNDPKCKNQIPPLIEHHPGHFAACRHV